jgi:alkylhydroperoxidase/carboxymuconolactone decarboxylase family protein YurZ
MSMPVNLPAHGDVEDLPPELLEIMRVMRQSIEQTFSIDTRAASFARLGALAAIGVGPDSLKGHVDYLLATGSSPAEIWGVMFSIIGHIGMPRFVAMIPSFSEVLGPYSSDG